MSKFTDVEKLNWTDRPYPRWLTLFVSGGTQICCALPIVLVTMEFGAVAAILWPYHRSAVT